MIKKNYLLIITFFLLYFPSIFSVSIITIDVSLQYPWGMTWLNSKEMLITQKNGKIYRINTENETKVEIKHSIPSVEIGQGGLLDIVSEGNNIWVTCSLEKDGKYTTGVFFARLNTNKLIDLQLIYEVKPYSKNTIHFGSRIEIKDEYLYISVGERGEGLLAQDTTTAIGSIIRLKKDGTIGIKEATNKDWKPELFQIGVRNPQGMSIDPVSGNVFISNHGPMGGDFIGPVLNGTNYGWNKVAWGGLNYNGTKVGNGNAWEPGFLKPSYSWVPSIGIGGIKFYVGDIFPEWNNQLLIASLKFKYLSLLKRNGNNFIEEEIIFKDKIGRVRDIEINKKGEIFLIADEKDTFLYKLTE